MSWKLFCSIVDQIPNVARAALHGVGEPMLVKNLPRMVHYLKDRGTYVLFNTNGTVLNPIGRQPAKRHDIVELGAGDGGEWSVMRCHVVPERGRRAVLCLKFGRPSVTERWLSSSAAGRLARRAFTALLDFAGR
jgi:hypothetical protein